MLIKRKLAGLTSARSRTSAPAISTEVSPVSADALEDYSDRKARETAKTYFEQALAFEKSKQDTLEQSRATAWNVTRGFGGLAGVAIIGAFILVFLNKPAPPVVLRDNTATGEVQVIDAARSGHISFGELEDRAALRRYVELREGYDWETIQDAYDSVLLMSNPREQDQYKALYDRANAPQKLLTDKFRVISKVGAITFVGSTAQVFFSRQLLALSGTTPPKTEYWVATITYEHDNLPAKSSELELNPTGFKVTSYTVDRDWTRSGTDSAAGAAPASGTTGGGAR
ncbi:virB8 family protein [Burkholderia territorii]|uniref:virB8 family protein n=1 Tax=Burkholderia territorii TaxID=1503055 RepID=UPI000AC0DBFD|nr:type IV secretion system protein [Burkholderia territorii]